MKAKSFGKVEHNREALPHRSDGHKITKLTTVPQSTEAPRNATPQRQLLTFL